MKITDEVLIELGFVYNDQGKSFDYEISDDMTLIIFNQENGEYWLYVNSTPPGTLVLHVMDIVVYLLRYSFNEGEDSMRKEIRKLLKL